MKKTAFALGILFCLLFSSCRSLPINFEIGKKTVVAYEDLTMTDAEVRLIALQYKLQFEENYSELLGNEFWGLSVSEDVSYDTYIKEYFVYKECRALLYLSSLCEEEGISLTEVERDEIKKRAADYLKALTEDEKTYTGASKRNVEQVMSLYALGEKMISVLTKDHDTEVSQEESRVVDIEVIHMKDPVTAEYTYDRLLNGESFLQVAKEVTTDSVIEYSVARGELVPELDSVIFSMKNNEISDVIRVGEDCYLIRMENAYNSLLSQQNKQTLMANKRFAAWQDYFEECESEDLVLRDKVFWEELTLSTEGDFPQLSLFIE